MENTTRKCVCWRTVDFFNKFCPQKILPLGKCRSRHDQKSHWCCLRPGEKGNMFANKRFQADFTLQLVSRFYFPINMRVVLKRVLQKNNTLIFTCITMHAYCLYLNQGCNFSLFSYLKIPFKLQHTYSEKGNKLKQIPIITKHSFLQVKAGCGDHRT